MNSKSEETLSGLSSSIKKEDPVREIFIEPAETERTERIQDLTDSFKTIFGSDRPFAILSGPGRTELAGNHTDHQLGQVICASVDLDILGAVSRNDEGVIRIYSQGYEPVILDLENYREREYEPNTSLSLVAGVLDYLEQNGYKTGGFDAVFHSQIPSGSGLSSSAAYEILIGQILNYLYNNQSIDPILLARAGQYAENEYFGKPSGLMDQMGSSVGGAISIDFSDPKNPRFEKIDLDPSREGYDLFIVNTHSSHMDLTDEYASIPNEMKQVANYFGQEVLGPVQEEQILASMPQLRSLAGDRALLRSLHFVRENQRVNDQKKALVDGDFNRYLELVNASGNSSMQLLQNIWSSANPQEQSLNLALILAGDILKGQGAVRVHGGGFGGTIQAYVPKAVSEEFTEKMERVFGKDSCYRILIRPFGGGVLVEQTGKGRTV